MEERRLNLDGVVNVRDLGGLKNKQGQDLKMGQFYRGAALHNITPTGLATAKEKGLKDIIDLRSTQEYTRNPDDFPSEAGFVVHNIPMLDNLMSNMANDTDDYPESMAEMYINILSHHQDGIGNVFEVFAQKDGGVLFHCSIGKDRTGVISMLTLGIADVPEELIVMDYSMTGTVEPPVSSRFAAPSYVFKSEPQTMEETLAWVNENYGSITGYLNKIGVGSHHQNAVKSAFGLI